MTATRCPLLPTGNYVALVVRPVLARSSGILLPNEVSRLGDVVAIGPDCEIVSVGDTLIYGQWTTRITVGETTYLLVQEDHLLASITGDEYETVPASRHRAGVGG